MGAAACDVGTGVEPRLRAVAAAAAAAAAAASFAASAVALPVALPVVALAAAAARTAAPGAAGAATIGGSLVFDNTPSNRFGGGGGGVQHPAGGGFGGGVFGLRDGPAVMSYSRDTFLPVHTGLCLVSSPST